MFHIIVIADPSGRRFVLLADHLHHGVLRGEAEGFVEGPGSGVAFPCVEGDVVEAVFGGVGFGVLEEGLADVAAAGGFIYAQIVEV